MTDPAMAPDRILVSVELPTPEQISPLLIGLLASVDVLLLGWYEVPEQTAPEQAAAEFGEEAEAALEEVAAAFRDAGASVEPRTVFTPDHVRTVARVAGEEGCAAILVLRPLYHLERILVPISGPILVERLATFLRALVGNEPLRIALLGLASEDVSDEPRPEGTVESPAVEAVAAALVEAGLPADRITRLFEVSDHPAAATAGLAEDHDLVVVAEAEPEDEEGPVLGPFPEALIRRCHNPVIVVRGPAA